MWMAPPLLEPDPDYGEREQLLVTLHNKYCGYSARNRVSFKRRHRVLVKLHMLKLATLRKYDREGWPVVRRRQRYSRFAKQNISYQLFFFKDRFYTDQDECIRGWKCEDTDASDLCQSTDSD